MKCIRAERAVIGFTGITAANDNYPVEALRLAA
jgi:hypothetical protein